MRLGRLMPAQAPRINPLPTWLEAGAAPTTARSNLVIRRLDRALARPRERPEAPITLG
jgi:hypothetical protein